MSNAAAAEKRTTDTSGSGKSCGGYVPGYVPVAINRDVVDTLRQFRRKNMTVDQIGRAHV